MGRALFFMCMMIALTPRAALAEKVVDIVDFGAVPDDGKDDAPAINAAIDAAAQGETVRIGKGVWHVAAPIVAKSNLSIAGAGRDETVLRFIGSAPSVLLQLDCVTNARIAKLTLDGANSQHAAQGVQARDSSELHLSDLAVQNLAAKTGFGPHGIYFAANVTNSTIENCALVNIGTTSEWGAGIRISRSSSNNRVLGNSIENTGRGGILCDNNSADLVIRRNTIIGSGKSSNGNGYGLGIELWGGAHRSVVEDNRLDHWLSVDSSNLVAVRRNVISSKSGPHKWTGLELVDSQDAVFTDNTVDGGAKIGISISGAGAKRRVYWGHNTIRNSSTWGAQVQGEAGKAARMYFYMNTFTGSTKNGPHTLYAPQGHGFRFNGGGEDIVLDSNTITANEGAGVQIGGDNLADLRFLRNTITKNKGPAVEGPRTPFTWYANAIKDNRSNSVNEQPTRGTKIPFAMITCDGAARAGEPLKFAVKVTGIGPMTNVLWDLGASIPRTTPTATHEYAAPGKYRVTAVAWDAAGQAAFCEMAIDVAPAPRADADMSDIAPPDYCWLPEY